MFCVNRGGCVWPIIAWSCPSNLSLSGQVSIGAKRRACPELCARWVDGRDLGGGPRLVVPRRAVALVHVAEATSTSQRRLQSTVYILSRLSQYVIYWLSHLEKFYVVSPAVPNGAGDHRAARTPPWRGAVRWSPPTCGPPTHNGLYGPGFI